MMQNVSPAPAVTMMATQSVPPPSYQESQQVRASPDCITAWTPTQSPEYRHGKGPQAIPQGHSLFRCLYLCNLCSVHIVRQSDSSIYEFYLQTFRLIGMQCLNLINNDLFSHIFIYSYIRTGITLNVTFLHNQYSIKISPNVSYFNYYYSFCVSFFSFWHQNKYNS